MFLQNIRVFKVHPCRMYIDALFLPGIFITIDPFPHIPTNFVHHTCSIVAHRLIFWAFYEGLQGQKG